MEEVSLELIRQEGIMRREMITDTCPWAQSAGLLKVLSEKISSKYSGFDF